jgi:hypothetical protein
MREETKRPEEEEVYPKTRMREEQTKMRIDIGSLNIQGITSANMENKIGFVIGHMKNNGVEIMLLQDMNLAIDSAQGTREQAERLLATENLILLHNKREPGASNGDSGMIISQRTKEACKRIKYSRDGRTTSIIISGGGRRVKLISTYQIPNPHQKTDQAARVLFSSQWGENATIVIQGGDFNCPLTTEDKVTEYPHIGKQIKGIPFTMLLDYLQHNSLIDAMSAAGRPGYTHRQHVSKGGLCYSRKDFIFVRGPIRLSNAAVAENNPNVSDHNLISISVLWSTSDDEREARLDRPRPKFKDEFRMYSDDKINHLVLYSKHNKSEIIKVLENAKFVTKGMEISQVGDQIALRWKSFKDMETNIRIWGQRKDLQAKLKLGKCFLRVQKVQNQQKIPSQFSTYSTSKKLNWIESVIANAVETVAPSNRKKTQQLESRRHTKSKSEHPFTSPVFRKACIISQRLQQMKEILKYKHQSTQFKVRLANLNRCINTEYYFKMKSLRTVMDVEKAMAIFKGKLKKTKAVANSPAARSAHRTRQAFEHASRSLRGFFDIVLERNSLEKLEENTEGEVELDHQEEKLLEVYQSWTPPMIEAPRLSLDNTIMEFQAWLAKRGTDVRICNNCKVVGQEEDWAELDAAITVEDIKSVCRKKNPAAGISKISFRMILYSSDRILELLAETLTEIVQKGNIPREMKAAYLRPLQKKPGVPIHHSSRPITLLESNWKIITAIVAKRMQKALFSHPTHCAHAYGFLKGKKIQSPLVLKQGVEELARKRGEVYFILEVDISKAYDNTRGHLIDVGLARWNVPKSIRRLVENMRQDAFSYVLHGRKVLGRTKAETLRQGDPLSCLLFVAQLDILLTTLQQETEGVLISGQNRVKVAAFADDITTYHCSLQDLQLALNLMEEFFGLQNQSINASKTVIRVVGSECPIENIPELNGVPLKVIYGEESSRYLGLELSPSGCGRNMRHRISDIIERTATLLGTNLVSTSLRKTVVNKVLIPKLQFLLSQMPMRVIDLEIWKSRIQEIIDAKIPIPIMFLPEKFGGAGLTDISLTAMAGYMRTICEELETDGIGSICLTALLDLEKETLETSINPLQIDVSTYQLSKTEPKSLIKTFREYRCFLQCTVIDNQETLVDELDLHHVLPVEDTEHFLKSKATKMQPLYKRIRENGYALGNEVLQNGWYLNETSPSLRSATQCAALMIRDQSNGKLIQRTSLWPNSPTTPRRLPLAQELKMGSVVAYGIQQVLRDGEPLLLPKFGVLLDGALDRLRRTRTSNEMVTLRLLYWENEETMTDVDMHLPKSPSLKAHRWNAKEVTVPQVFVISFPRVTEVREEAHMHRFNLDHKRWKQDILIARTETIRRWRAYSWEYLKNQESSVQQQVAHDQREMFVFTDGSFTSSERYSYEGAGAMVVPAVKREDAQCYAYTLPSLDMLTAGGSKGSIRSELVAMVLGLLSFYRKWKGKCVLVSDNQALCNMVDDQDQWNRLETIDGSFGVVLKNLLELQLVSKVQWIAAHQQQDGSLLTWGNAVVDIIADAAKRQAQIKGEYVDLPMASSQRFTLVGNDREIASQYVQQSVMAKRQGRVRDMPATTDLLLSASRKQFTQRISRIVYGNRNDVKLVEDDAVGLYRHKVGMHIRSGHCIRSIQEMLDRPDIYGRKPKCPLCGSGSVAEGWHHILYKCDEVASVVKKWKLKVGSISYDILHEQRKRNNQASAILVQTSDYQVEEISFPCKCAVTRFRKDCKALDEAHRPSVQVQGDCVDTQEQESNEEMLMEASVLEMKLHSPTEYINWKASFVQDSGASVMALNPRLYMALSNIFHGELGLNWENYRLCPRFEDEDGISKMHPSVKGDWLPVVAWKMEDSWFSSDRRLGKACQHANACQTTGGIIILNEAGRGQWTNVALADFRPFYQELVGSAMRRRQGKLPESKLLYFAKDPRAASFLKTPYIGSIDLCTYRLRLPSEEPENEEACAQYWLGRSAREMITLYRGMESQGMACVRLFRHFLNLANQLEKLAKPRLVDYKKTEMVTFNLARILTHLNEWRRDTIPCPYVELPRSERNQVLENLATNRARLAQNQETIRVRPHRLK